jgi:hypothetical protein
MLIAGSTNSQYTDFHLDCLLFISFFIVFRKRKRGKINKKPAKYIIWHQFSR